MPVGRGCYIISLNDVVLTGKVDFLQEVAAASASDM